MQSIPRTIMRNVDIEPVTSEIQLAGANAVAYMIGKVIFPPGTVGPKTVSSAGAKVFLRLGATMTMANAATLLTFGFQDVNASGIEDGTFDVSADLAGDAGVLVADRWNGIAMTSGSKDVTDGDRLAVGVKMVTRGGVDLLRVQCALSLSQGAGTPYASWGGKLTRLPMIAFQTDDGTWGRFVPQMVDVSNVISNQSVSTATNPSEVGPVFTLAAPMTIDSVELVMGDLDATDDVTVRIYSDPYGTPVQVGADINVDATFWSDGSSNVRVARLAFGEEIELAAGTYIISVLPSTADAIVIGYVNLGVGNADLKALCGIGGDSCALAGRSGGAGAFAVIDDDYMPIFGLGVTQIGSGGGGTPSTILFRSRQFGFECSVDDGATWLRLNQAFNAWRYDAP